MVGIGIGPISESESDVASAGSSAVDSSWFLFFVVLPFSTSISDLTMIED